jgi:hypothetical protein
MDGLIGNRFTGAAANAVWSLNAADFRAAPRPSAIWGTTGVPIAFNATAVLAHSDGMRRCPGCGHQVTSSHIMSHLGA